MFCNEAFFSIYNLSKITKKKDNHFYGTHCIPRF